MVPAQVGGADSLRYRLESRLADRPSGLLALLVLRVREERGRGEDHRHRVRDVLALERGRGAVGCLGHQGGGTVGPLVAERDEEGLRSGDRAEQRQDEVGENVAVAVERGNHHRRAARRDQERERRVDQLRLVGDLRVTLRRGVHLLLQHSLVDRADRVLRSAEHLGSRALGLAEREFRDRAADAALDLLGAKSDLVVPGALRHSFAPYASPTAIRTTEIGEWTPPTGSTPGIRRPVRTITLPPISSRRMRFGEPTSSRPSGVIVAALRPSPWAAIARAASCTTAFEGLAPLRRREIEARRSSSKPEDLRLENANRGLEQLLAGLVAFENDDRSRIHRGGSVDGRAASHWGWKMSEIRAYNGRRVLVIYLAETASAFFAIGGNRGTKDSARL